MSIISSLLPSFKDVVTSRGYNYTYYFSAPTQGKPTLLFIHGFPSLALDWHHQIVHFKQKGYGLVVPNQLGYGGSDKPAEIKDYVQNLIANDMVEILDHENVTYVISIGHDWGCNTTSVLANLYADRFIAFGFLAVGYLPPLLEWNINQLRDYAIKQVGYETFGYWEYFTAPDALSTIKKHPESFYDLIYAKDARVWRYNVCPVGAARVFVESDTRTPRVTFIGDELWQLYKEEFDRDGLDGPLNFYRAAVDKISAEYARKIPLENYKVHKPVFFGTASKDPICVDWVQEQNTRQFCSNTTVAKFNTTHWVAAEAPKEVNEALERWIEGVVLA